MMDVNQLENSTLGNCTIERLLGKGGMGVVYRARQVSLDRTIALKILLPDLSTDPSFVKRFHKEARAVAQLNHPNIIQIYDISEDKGLFYFCMEYIEGKTIESMLAAEGKLDAKETAGIASQVAAALEHAHRKGIIHRDIKPSNIILDDSGNAKVMDFGLARTMDKDSKLTMAGTLMGTLHYMSPEQCRGEELDARTDIYSVGVLLYEMLTGRTPFEAPNEAALIDKIIHELPASLEDINPEAPRGLSHIAHRAMTKDRETRYAHVSELLDDLNRFQMLEPGTPTIPLIPAAREKPSIAVLPFVDMSPQKDQEYFCDGLSEEIINALTQLEDFRVIARTSAFSFKDQNVDVRDIGKRLSVETVLEGSVRKAGNRLRITAQLIDVAGGHHLWSERYDRELDDVFAIQDEISEAIVNKLKPRERDALCKCQTMGFEAYDLYLKGRYFWNKMTEESLNKAIEHFKQVIKEAPDCALAYSGLADSYNILPFFSPTSPREMYGEAKKAALEALYIDETLGEAHSSLASILVRYEWNWEQSEKEHRRAIELNPGYATAHHMYAMYLLYLTRFNEAVEETTKAHMLDPLSPMINANSGQILTYAGYPEQAEEKLDKAIELDPNLPYVHLQRGSLLFQKGLFEEGMAEIEKERINSKGRNPTVEAFIATAYAMLGDKTEALDTLDKLLKRSEKEYVSPYTVSRLYFALGEIDVGFEWLEKAHEERDHWLCFLNVHYPAEDGLRSDPRFAAMLKKIGLMK